MRKIFTIAILALSINAFSQIPTSGLIGWWPFQGNANDISGNGNNGTVNGATLTTDRFGNPNSAYLFNGTTDFIQMVNGGITGSSSRTVSFWAKTSFTGEMVPFDYGDANGNGGTFQIQFNNACSGIGLDVSNGVVTWGSNSFLDNSWHHFAIVLDAIVGTQVNQILVYADGVLISTSTCGALNQNAVINTVNTNPIRIGKVADNGNVRHFNGSLDDFFLYDRALDFPEIQSLFNNGICYQTITVTDTLIINANLTGFNPVTFENTIKIYPNPTSDHITIDFGSNYSTMNGYTLKITNSLSQIVYTTPINTQSTTVDLSTWTGNGIYFVHLIDAQSNTIDIRKIVLQ